MSTTMTVTAKAIHKDAKAEVSVPEITTIADPQWAAWNMTEADICNKALRQLRVDWQNGGLRDAIGEAYTAGKRDKALVTVAREWLAAWKLGQQRSSKKVLDARGMNLNAKAVKHFESQGYTVLTD